MNYTRVATSGEQIQVEVRTLEDEIDHWLGHPDYEYPQDPLLPHLSDQDIYGLDDSFDDGRVGTLISAYVRLRQKFKELSEILEASE